MDKTIAAALTRARTSLILTQPFYGMLALRLKFVEDLGTKTLAVDGRHMFYNPEFIRALPSGQIKTAVAHEVMHCVLDHMGRRGDRNPRKFNKAGDYVINLGLTDSGFEAIPGWLHNPAFADMSTDHVYSLLPDEDDGNDPLDDCMPGAQDGTGQQAVEWKIATVQAATVAKAEGKLPSSLARFIEELTAQKVDWKAMLRRFITETSKNDYSWARLNRRFQSQGIFLPSLYSETMGEIVVVIDTSGSIDQPTLNAFGAEIAAIVENTRPSKTTVIYCDAAINHVDEFSPDDTLKFEMHGGGGTSFIPPFEYVTEKDMKPVCLVYLTDGFGPFPDAPDYPTMWVMTTNVIAPFGETIPIEI